MNSPRPPVRQARGDATRHAILDAAERIFANVGYAAARLEDVAQTVGIRRPSIVYHFPGKQELYDAVEADIFTSMHAFAAERLTDVADPMARLIALLDAWLDFMVGRPTAARIIQRLIADAGPRGSNPVEFSETVLADMDAIVRAGVESGAFRPVSAIQLVNGVGGGSLFYICNARQVGDVRAYDPADPAELTRFRALLHRLARAAVLPDQGS